IIILPIGMRGKRKRVEDDLEQDGGGEISDSGGSDNDENDSGSDSDSDSNGNGSDENDEHRLPAFNAPSLSM
ncbi:hypothetical protein BG000_007191, partial [Podila horticola]